MLRKQLKTLRWIIFRFAQRDVYTVVLSSQGAGSLVEQINQFYQSEFNIYLTIRSYFNICHLEHCVTNQILMIP